ncbi:MAG: hypothetical protein ABIH42_04255 [Planctomycetota bacterium]
MEEISIKLKEDWEYELTLMLEKEYDGAQYRLLKNNNTQTYQLNRYFKSSAPHPEWQVSVDLKDASAEDAIRYFWEHIWYDPVIKTMADSLEGTKT